MILRSVVTVLALACTTSAAAGQSLTTQVQPGARIRVTQPLFIDGVDVGRVHRPQVGTLVSIDSTSITALMEKDGTLLTLPFSAINRLQISQGAQSANRGSIRGMLKGAVIGGGLITAFYYAVKRAGAFEVCEFPEDPDMGISCRSGGPNRLAVIAGSTLGGAAIGFGMGSRQREAWQVVLPQSLRMVPRPSDLSLSVSLRF